MSDGTAKTPADHFRDLADKIERNKPEDFGGAFLIIPPDGEPIASILVGQPDLASFFAVVSGKLQVAVNAADEKSKRQQAFGR